MVKKIAKMLWTFSETNDHAPLAIAATVVATVAGIATFFIGMAPVFYYMDMWFQWWKPCSLR